MAEKGVVDGWCYEANGAEQGPVSSRILKRLAETGKLKPSSRVRRQGDGRWLIARDVKGLFKDAIESDAAIEPDDTTNQLSASVSQGLSEWGLASVLVGGCFLIAQNTPGHMLHRFGGSSLTTILLVLVSELVLLGGICFGLIGGIVGWLRASRAGKALPIAGIVVSAAGLMQWLIQLISIIRYMDNGR